MSKATSQVIKAEVSFQSDFHKKEVSALFPVSPQQSFAVRFSSPDELLFFIANLLDHAATVWPDDPNLKEYSDG